MPGPGHGGNNQGGGGGDGGGGRLAGGATLTAAEIADLRTMYARLQDILERIDGEG
mgnify:FL=1